MTLEEILKRYDCRLSLSGDKWLVWWQSQWFVFQHKSYAKKTLTLIQTDDLQEALTVLTKDEEPES